MTSRLWFVAAALVHLLAIATFYPDLGMAIPVSLSRALLVASFTLMSVTALVHCRQPEDQRALGPLVLGLGVGQLSITMLAVLDISIGPANPLAMQESFSPAIKIGWFVGFNAIAVMGCNFFVAKPTLEIAQFVYAPLRRIAGPVAFAIAAAIGTALGALAEAGLHSQGAQRVAAWANDPKAIVALILVPVVLGGLASLLKRS